MDLAQPGKAVVRAAIIDHDNFVRPAQRVKGGGEFVVEGLYIIPFVVQRYDDRNR